MAATYRCLAVAVSIYSRVETASESLSSGGSGRKLHSLALMGPEAKVRSTVF